MKIKRTYITILFFLFAALSGGLLSREKPSITSPSYFPANTNITLVYNSSFGESFSTYVQDGELTIISNKADKFKYKQTMIIKEDGVYIKETYQYLKIFLFIKKEGTFTYGKPLLRFPLPLSPGMKWEANGDEYSHGDTNKVKVTGRAVGKEFVNTPAGKFKQ